MTFLEHGTRNSMAMVNNKLLGCDPFKWGQNNLGKATLMLIASEVSFVSYQPVRLQQGFCRVNSWLKLHGTVDIKHSKPIAISAALFFSVSQSHQSRIHFFMDIWQITVVLLLMYFLSVVLW